MAEKVEMFPKNTHTRVHPCTLNDQWTDICLLWLHIFHEDDGLDVNAECGAA